MNLRSFAGGNGRCGRDSRFGVLLPKRDAFMFPYIKNPEVVIGPVSLWIPGLLAALSLVLGYFRMRRQARLRGLSVETASRFIAVMIVGGFVCSHLFKFLYVPGAWGLIISQPILLLLLLNGMSSFGGIFGALVSGAAYLVFTRVRGEQLRRYFDALVFVFPACGMVARSACYVAHDHPGIRTTSWFGVPYPDSVRYDLALLEILFYLLWILVSRPWPVRFRASSLGAGSHAGVFLLCYGAFRILLDRLHVDVERYWILSVDQWASLGACVCGIAFLFASVVPSLKGQLDLKGPLSAAEGSRI